MSKFKTLIMPPLVLFLICLIIAAALAGTNALTKDKIASIELETQNEAMAKMVEADSFDETTLNFEGEDITYYKAMSAGKTEGYIFITQSKGYGGNVKVMTAVGEDGKIIAMEVLSASDETPGLGGNAAKSEWWEQFKGMSGDIAVKKDGGEVDALTGATITSRAVSKAVDTALDYYNELEAE